MTDEWINQMWYVYSQKITQPREGRISFYYNLAEPQSYWFSEIY